MASVLYDEGTIGESDPTPAAQVVSPINGIVLYTLNVHEAEAALIARALEVTGGNRTRAAGLLGLSVRTLRNKLNGRAR